MSLFLLGSGAGARGPRGDCSAFCVAVVDLYWENEATHQWIDTLKVPVELFSIDDYRSLFIDAGFENIRDERILDPRPVPDDYTSGSFKSREDYVSYRETGSLMISGEAKK